MSYEVNQWETMESREG